MFIKGNPSLINKIINKKPELKLFFVSILNRCLSSLQITFNSFFRP